MPGRTYSHYTGLGAIDTFRGPYQNETGSDGIVDTLLILDRDNVDYYPLIIPRSRNRISPVARFYKWSSETRHVGEAISLDARTSTPGWNGTQVMFIKEYRWDFEDGNLTSTVHPRLFHTYAFLGTFTLTLTIIDTENINSSISAAITVVMPTFISISTSSPFSLAAYKVDVSGRLSDLYEQGLKSQTISIIHFQWH